VEDMAQFNQAQTSLRERFDLQWAGVDFGKGTYDAYGA
jgi:hypothetical protein